MVTEPSESKASPDRWRLSVHRFGLFTALVGAVQIICLSFRHQAHFCDLVSHFTLFLVVDLLGVLVLCAWARCRYPALANAMVLGVLLIYAGEYLPRAPALDGVPAGSLSLISFNVRTQNTNKADVLEMLVNQEADLVLLSEVDDAWIEGMSPLHEHYPHRAAAPRPDNFGLALYSKYPIRWKIFEDRGVSVQYVDADVEHPDGTIHFIGIHTLPPIWAGGWRQSKQQIDEIVHRIGEPRRLIIAGDLNATPNGSLFRTLVDQAGLKPAGRAWRLWPTWGPGLAMLQIDHIFVSADLSTSDEWVGSGHGSDHRPIHARIVWKDEAP
jgi:endonuclease/exonuclease/phosphatase (EEP) superfamily protein YafD